ncbi:uncharacterized protein LOC113461224 isoform X2 [Phoenix dactylifera]|uniref:Uncharacterized protein LOC113461224 isoform X2 n=1 Tax=Phoenix dactylifera TaxID=42345 RepID=A0A8B8ZPU2_PHODC|nr:uncharacterized protein LOC113461224 isoform X2 [Phoenix dactylifera]
MTEEEVARVCPPDVYHHQWRELVHYWFSERGQTYSDIGRAARASQTIPHTSGSKSYASLRAEFMEDHGRKPGEVEFYKMTHTHRDGSFVLEESRDIVDRATSLISERIGESSSIGNTRGVEAQVFTELMGSKRYGRVRGYGVGVTPTQLSPVGRYTQDVRQSSSTAEVNDLKAEIKELKQSHQTEMQSLRAQINQITSLLHQFVPPQRW